MGGRRNLWDKNISNLMTYTLLVSGGRPYTCCWSVGGGVTVSEGARSVYVTFGGKREYKM